MLRAGDALDAYRVVAPLGAGGMAELYLARREGAAGFARPVALKVIHPRLASSPGFVEMFIEEARLCATIDDPNVVKVDELGDSSGVLYLAMEYIHGASLAEVVRAVTRAERRLSYEVVAHFGACIAAGLHAAHTTCNAHGTPLGIVHRDVSPQNVLVAFNGHVKVIDFGLAKAWAGAAGDVSGTVRGKPAYMAPEQALGARLDARADVFALGIVLWELVAMRRLYDAPNDVAQILQARDAIVAPPSKHASDIPRALEEVILRALDRDRDRRWATAAELGRALLRAVPSAREIDAAHVAALLRAVMPGEIAAKSALVAETRSEPRAGVEVEIEIEMEAATPVRIGTHEALTRLTLPVVDADADADADANAKPSATLPRARRPRRRDVAGVAVVLTGALAAIGTHAAVTALQRHEVLAAPPVVDDATSPAVTLHPPEATASLAAPTRPAVAPAPQPRSVQPVASVAAPRAIPLGASASPPRPLAPTPPRVAPPSVSARPPSRVVVHESRSAAPATGHTCVSIEGVDLCQ